jgi:hypothetical protein
MVYQKPEVVPLTPAILAVQNPTDKHIQQVFDGSELASASAYPADE